MIKNGKNEDRKVIAFVIYPGTPPLDLVGTWQFLSALAMKGYEPVVVAESLEPVPSDTPLKFIPQKSFGDVPHPQGLVVLGGGVASLRAMASDALLAYVRSAAETAEVVASVGTGSLILGAAGLLADRQATTHWTYARILENLGSRYVRQRYVEDGKFLTAGGDTAGIDMALYLLAKMEGTAAARFQQLWAEYDPQPPFGPINWSEVERAPLSTILAPYLGELRRALRHQPRLLGAVEAATGTPEGTPAGHQAPAGLPGTVAHPDKKVIAFVLYPGLTVFDLVGPLQVLSRLTQYARQFETVVVAERPGPVESDSKLAFIPDRTFDQVPTPFAFVVPGGSIPTLRAMSNPAIRNYIRNAGGHAEIVASVCTGALLLASVGLLRGRTVPTHWAFASVLERYGARYVRRRWVEDGRFVISAGVSAGIDSALVIAGRLADPVTARRVQRDIEYDPQPPLGRIVYDNLDWQSWLMKNAISLTAPFWTAKPKHLTRREQRSLLLEVP